MFKWAFKVQSKTVVQAVFLLVSEDMCFLCGIFRKLLSFLHSCIMFRGSHSL